MVSVCNGCMYLRCRNRFPIDWVVGILCLVSCKCDEIMLQSELWGWTFRIEVCAHAPAYADSAFLKRCDWLVWRFVEGLYPCRGIANDAIQFIWFGLSVRGVVWSGRVSFYYEIVKLYFCGLLLVVSCLHVFPSQVRVSTFHHFLV